MAPHDHVNVEVAPVHTSQLQLALHRLPRVAKCLRRPARDLHWRRFASNQSSIPLQEKTMNPLSFFTSPVTAITRAFTYPLKMLYVVTICSLVNVMTSPGVWWVQWVVFGMGIGLITVWFRALKTIVATIGFAAIGYFVYRWWKNRHEPDAAGRALAEAKPLMNNAAA
jgi:hypothetical protein